jgi:hypothetical protein
MGTKKKQQNRKESLHQRVWLVSEHTNQRNNLTPPYLKGKTSLLKRFSQANIMKIIKGWKKIDNQRGFVNETTGHNLIVTKKQFGEHYIVMLYPSPNHNDYEEGAKLSPEYATEAKAAAFAMNWMSKHPNE